ncbi:hypothetical protein OV079_44245 [Nannocystis pusilla]|uniref:Uncharacterized protein n=1 Tax=Nannocystis pusilla TaxID=889268 RepID=A0A9X3J3U1_9BACT|nr:hypothetical protein [Nannocystis pusilla]MCY1012433.1 hypothetical protein [Nannocystis pusilla]
MTLTSKPRTAALIPAGVLLFAAAASPEALAAAQEPAAPATDAAPAAESSAAPAEASAAPAEASAPPAAPASAGAQASAGAGKAEVKADASVPKARKSGRRQAPDGVILDEKTGKVKDTRKWIHRYSPERHLFELGIFGGLNLPPDDHDLYKPVPGRPDEHKALWRLGPAVGARVGYFPLRIFGVEAEFSATPTFVRNVHNSPAFVYGLRGSAVLHCRTASRRSCSAATACSASARRATASAATSTRPATGAAASRSSSRAWRRSASTRATSSRPRRPSRCRRSPATRR